MKQFLLIPALLIIMFTANAQDTLRGLVFGAVLDTLQQDSLSQPVSARGVAAFLLLNDSLKFEITVNGLSGEITEAGIHNESDSILMSLDDFINGNSIRGSLSGMTLNDSLTVPLLNGTAFFVIHTEANPNGEVRGRIKLESDINYGAELTTEQAGIPDTLDMMPQGLSSFNLSLDSTMLEISVQVNQLTSAITNAHLHYGAPGVNGPPVVPLMPYLTGNMIRGFVNLDTLPNRQAFVDSLEMGLVYVNVHTVNYPQGEIRGQLGKREPLAFEAHLAPWLANDSINPETPPGARGLMHMYVNSMMDTLMVHILVDSLSGQANSVNFHLGSEGPVVVPLTDSISGNMIMATLTAEDPQFSEDMDFTTFLDELLNNMINIVVVTDLNPSGELEGPVTGVQRNGTIFQLCSRQEVGTVTNGEKSQGSGFVSIDRNRNNLHYGIAVAGLSSALTGAHFHQAPAGQNGPVIHPLPTDSVVSGFWNDSTFTTDIAALIESGEVYANFHTTVNPEGEIRGQVMWGELCSAPLAVNEIFENEYNVSLYPNPVQSALTLEYQLEKSALVELRVFDLIGKEVSRVALGNKNAGNYKHDLNASQLQNGLYIYSLYLNGQVVSKSKILVNR